MQDNICKFVKTKNVMENLNIINFIYEKEAKFKHFFIIPSCYGLYIVTSGSGALHTKDGIFEINKGDLFFTFSSKPYFIENYGNLQYIYITFIGLRASGLFTRLKISYSSPVYHEFDFLCNRWMSDFEKANENNIDLICEGLLLHTLSYLCDTNEENSINNKVNGIVKLKQYVDTHYTESELTLNSISKQFSYSSKYVSYAFINLTKISFSKYLTDLRLKHAQALIKGGMSNISDIATACGYNDPQLFSKNFKKQYGTSPRNFIKNISK